jgi:glycosyltransferase involved in cell wall biosynthesis
MLKNKLRYDVIFPFYKDFKYLDQSIDNLNAQLLLPINLIFVDDGNGDESLKSQVFSKLDSSIRLKYLNHSKNLGTIMALNTAFKHIESEYFFIMAADDIYNKNLSLNSLLLLNKFKQASFVVSNPIMNFAEKNKKKFISYNFLKKNFYCPSEVKVILKKFSIKFYHNTTFYRSSIFLKDHLFREDLGPRCDFYNLVFLAQQNGFCYLNENLAEFTIRKNQTNKYHSDAFLIKEIKEIKTRYPLLFKICKDANLFFDISPLGIVFINQDLKDLRNIGLLKKSFQFYIWKKLRIFIPSRLLNLMYNFIN